MSPLLEVTHLSYAYHTLDGETYALSDLSFQVKKGEFIAVVGPSGCGNPMVGLRKSTASNEDYMSILTIPHYLFQKHL